MESIGILRALLRRPLLLGLGGLLAVSVALLAGYRVSLMPPGIQSRAIASGFASQRLLVNTPTSLIADARAKGAPAIVIRTAILADQMESDGVRAELAKALGVPPGAVGVISSTTATPETESPLAEKALEVTRPHEPYVVSVGLEAGQPILSVLATAPDPDAAAKLAHAATASLTRAGLRAVPARGAVRVERIGAAEVGSKEASASKKKAVILAFVVFAIWCGAILVSEGARRRRPLSGWGGEREVRV